MKLWFYNPKRQRHTKTMVKKNREVKREVLKVQKDYGFDKTMVLENRRLVVSKHPGSFSKPEYFAKTVVFIRHSRNTVSKQGLRAYLGNPDRVLGGSCDKNKKNGDTNH